MTGKRVLSALGSLLALAGLLYIGHRLVGFVPARDVLRPSLAAGLLVAAGVCAAAQLLLAQAWRRILAHLGLRPPCGWVILSYSDYQASKYVPGNVANILGRQLHGSRQGYGAGAIALSTVLELSGMVLCGLVFWVIALLVRFQGSLVLALAAAVAVLGVAALLLRWRKAPELWAALALQLAFLLVLGAVFVGLAWLVAGRAAAPGLTEWVTLVSTFNAAWLVGMVTPGAPAGIGVRDGLLLAWAPATVSPADLPVVILLSRLATVLGDLLFWVVVRCSRLRRWGPFRGGPAEAPVDDGTAS